MTFEALNNTLSSSRTDAPAQSRIAAEERNAADSDERFAFAAAMSTRLNDRQSMTDELDEAALHQKKQQEQVREAAQQLVASAFVLPFLQQVRSESLRSDLMHGGYAEDAFGQQLDTHMADAFVQSGNFPLVDAVEQYMTKRGGPLPETRGQQLNLHG